MNDMEYKPNSHKSKEAQAQTEKKRVNKVVTGTARTKKNEVRKFTDIFISEDVSNVKEYLVKDMLVPTVKKAIIGALDMILNGDAASYSRDRRGESRVSYRKYSDDPRDSRSDRARPRFDYDDVVFPSRGEAEAARRQMMDVIAKYGFVSVGDLYDMADLTQPYTAHKYGWTHISDVRNADIVRVMGGDYIIKLPRAEALD